MFSASCCCCCRWPGMIQWFNIDKFSWQSMGHNRLIVSFTVPVQDLLLLIDVWGSDPMVNVVNRLHRPFSSSTGRGGIVIVWIELSARFDRVGQSLIGSKLLDVYILCGMFVYCTIEERSREAEGERERYSGTRSYRVWNVLK